MLTGSNRISITNQSTDRAYDVPNLVAHPTAPTESHPVAPAIPRLGRDEPQADCPYVGRP